jgi:hypothetical protein
MRATTIIIGIILFSMVLMGINVFYIEMKINYNETSDTGSTELLNTLNETYNFTIQAGSSLQGANEGTTQEGLSTSDSLIKGIQVFWDSFTILPKMINNAAGILHLPQWFVIGIVAIGLITLLVAILALIGLVKGA